MTTTPDGRRKSRQSWAGSDDDVKIVNSFDFKTFKNLVKRLIVYFNGKTQTKSGSFSFKL